MLRRRKRQRKRSVSRWYCLISPLITSATPSVHGSVRMKLISRSFRRSWDTPTLRRPWTSTPKRQKRRRWHPLPSWMAKSRLADSTPHFTPDFTPFDRRVIKGYVRIYLRISVKIGENQTDNTPWSVMKFTNSNPHNEAPRLKKVQDIVLIWKMIHYIMWFPAVSSSIWQQFDSKFPKNNASIRSVVNFRQYGIRFEHDQRALLRVTLRSALFSFAVNFCPHPNQF